MEQKVTTNPLAGIDECRPATTTQPSRRNEDPAVTRARHAILRERFLAVTGYTIVPDGPEKTLRVNREWITGGEKDQGQWLLFIDGGKPIQATEVLMLDEVQTEIEIMKVETVTGYGCGGAPIKGQKEVRSAYMISHGRVAYRPVG